MQFDDFVFDEGIALEGPIYSLDALLEAVADPVDYSVDAVFGSLGQKVYSLSTILNNDHATASYNIDAVLVLDRHDPKFRESIINAIYVSCARACEDLSTAISEMGLRMQLSYASGSDLDLYWSRVLSLRRRYLELDEDFRIRLLARTTLMKSSGTADELKTLVDTILGMTNAATFRTYWPAEIRVDWNSITAMKAAESKYDKIAEALNEAVASGVSWSTSFPYKEYLIDCAIAGIYKTSYEIDTAISKEKSSIYRLVVDLLNTGSKLLNVDANLETRRSHSQTLDTKLIKVEDVDYSVDGFCEGVTSWSYTNDVQLISMKNKTLNLDSVMTKDFGKIYDVDSSLEREKRGFYLVTCVLDQGTNPIVPRDPRAMFFLPANSQYLVVV